MTTSDKSAVVNIATTVVIAVVTLIINLRAASKHAKTNAKYRRKTNNKTAVGPLPILHRDSSALVHIVLWAIIVVAALEALYNAHEMFAAAHKGYWTVLLNLATFSVAALVCVGALVLRRRF